MKVLVAVFSNIIVTQFVLGQISRLGVSRMETERKISDGVLTRKDEYNSVVGLWIKFTNGSNTMCTGTVLDKRTVLTAARCVTHSSQIAVYLGCTDMDTCQQIRYGKGFVNPGFHVKRHILLNDIGLVITDRTLDTDAFAQLEKPAEYYPSCTTVLYGQITKEKCSPHNKLYKLQVHNVKPCSIYYPGDDRFENMLCCFSQLEKGFYLGSYGGPLFCQYKQVGVTTMLLEGINPITGDHEVMIVWTIPNKYARWMRAKMSAGHASSFVPLLSLALLPHFL